MHSIRSRFSTPVQIFILIFYIVLILVIKQMYDNHRRNQRFEKYNKMIRDVVDSLEVVERQAKKTVQSLGMFQEMRNPHSKSHNWKVDHKESTTVERNPTLKPP